MHRVHLQEWNVQNVPVLKSRLNSTSFPDTQVVHLHQQQPGCPSASCAWHEINKRCGPVCCFVHFAAFYCNVNVAAVYTGVQLAEMRVLLTWWCLCRFCSSKSGGQPCLFAGNIHQCWHWLVSKVLVDVPVSNIWFSKFGFVLPFPRLGHPSFGNIVQVWVTCFFQDLVVQVLVHFVLFPQDLVVQVLVYVVFSKTWLSKFWFMLFFLDLVVQVLVYVFVFQNLVVQVLVYAILPRLGCPSLGLRSSFAKTWLSKFWFLLFFPRLGCPSFGLCFCFPKLGCPSFGLCYFAKTWLSKSWSTF